VVCASEDLGIGRGYTVQVAGSLANDGTPFDLDVMLGDDTLAPQAARVFAAALLNAADEVDRLSNGDTAKLSGVDAMTTTIHVAIDRQALLQCSKSLGWDNTTAIATGLSLSESTVRRMLRGGYPGPTAMQAIVRTFGGAALRDLLVVTG
jgi:hypothetical protein